MQKDFNHKQYKNHYKRYIESNQEGNIGGYSPKERCELLKKFLPKGRTIFEIGSGDGKDALILKNAGYKVIASDYVQEFVNILSEKGLDGIIFDGKNDALPVVADCIYANAVFVHFSPSEIVQLIKKSKSKMNNEKILFTSVIKGIGHERSARSRGFERDFYYYSPESISETLQSAGLNILYLDDTDPKWIQVLATFN